ncbi:MAG: hypothetical protein LBJ17_08175 [Dysgonamonadaceae bacterium]|nr:hypothetical protein [Dysgonamonadaceae bacterium]
MSLADCENKNPYDFFPSQYAGLKIQQVFFTRNMRGLRFARDFFPAVCGAEYLDKICAGDFCGAEMLCRLLNAIMQGGGIKGTHKGSQYNGEESIQTRACVRY